MVRHGATHCHLFVCSLMCALSFTVCCTTHLSQIPAPIISYFTLGLCVPLYLYLSRVFFLSFFRIFVAVAMLSFRIISYFSVYLLGFHSFHCYLQFFIVSYCTITLDTVLNTHTHLPLSSVVEVRRLYCIRTTSFAIWSPQIY